MRDFITEWRKHDCGTPQGTILGPEGWLNLIDPLGEELKTTSNMIKHNYPGCSLLYADDILIAC